MKQAPVSSDRLGFRRFFFFDWQGMWHPFGLFLKRGSQFYVFKIQVIYFGLSNSPQL